MEVTLALAFAKDFNALQNFRLQGGPQTLDRLQPIIVRRLLELIERRDAKLLVDFQHLVWAQSRETQHLQCARRDFLAYCLKARMSARLVQLGDDVRDGVSDTGDLL